MAVRWAVPWVQPWVAEKARPSECSVAGLMAVRMAAQRALRWALHLVAQTVDWWAWRAVAEWVASTADCLVGRKELQRAVPRVERTEQREADYWAVW